ncbi:MAG: hypothetical protein ACREEE_00185 [Dongiaceae bacterium]
MPRLIHSSVLGLLAVLALAGCLPESRNPASAPETAVEDDRLLGL